MKTSTHLTTSLSQRSYNQTLIIVAQIDIFLIETDFFHAIQVLAGSAVQQEAVHL